MKSKIEHAGFGTRLTAFVLDVIILGLPFLFLIGIIIVPIFIPKEVILALQSNEELKYSDFRDLYNYGLKLQIIVIFLWALINALFLNSKLMATPGKRIMKLQVFSNNNSRISIKQGIGRFAALPLIILLLGAPERYMIHEKLDEVEDIQITVETNQEFAQIMTTPISGITNIIILLLISAWFLNINIREDKKAFHDILFDTKVIINE